jgi:hypothetical protein
MGLQHALGHCGRQLMNSAKLLIKTALKLAYRNELLMRFDLQSFARAMLTSYFEILA